MIGGKQKMESRNQIQIFDMRLQIAVTTRMAACPLTVCAVISRWATLRQVFKKLATQGGFSALLRLARQLPPSFDWASQGPQQSGSSAAPAARPAAHKFRRPMQWYWLFQIAAVFCCSINSNLGVFCPSRPLVVRLGFGRPLPKTCVLVVLRPNF